MTAHIQLLSQTITINQAGSAVIQLGDTNLLEGPASGSDSVIVVAPLVTWSWTATANASWLHLSAANPGGTGSTNLIFSFDANTGATRTSTLTIGGQTLTVTQAGSTYVQADALTTLVSMTNFGGVTVDSAGNVYIVNSEPGNLVKWTPTNDTVSTVLTAPNSFNFGSVAVDGYGNVFFVGTNSVMGGPQSGALEEWIAVDGTFITLASNLGDFATIALDGSDNVYITDPLAESIDEWDTADNYLFQLASGHQSYGVAVDAADNVYYSDYSAGAIFEWLPANGDTVKVVSSSLGYFPSSMCVDGGGNLYVAVAEVYSATPLDILKWSPTTGTELPLLNGYLSYNITGVAVDSARNLYLGESVPSPGLQELPYTFVDPTARPEPAKAGNDSLPVVLPANFNLNGPFAPTNDQPWLTITGVTNGVVSYSFSANNGLERTAHISLMGKSISVIQTNVLVTAPLLTRAQSLSNGGLEFTFTNTPGATFTVLATTNLALPLTNWANLGTVSNISPGIYQFTTQPLTNAQEFYEVIWP